MVDDDKTPAPAPRMPDTAARSGGASKPGVVVVGVGASAGGLAAMQEMLAELPRNASAAFVIVTHQPPEHPSLLPGLLRRMTVLPVREVVEGDVVEPGHVYVASPRGGLAIMNGALHEVTVSEEGASSHPIDFFFRSLARDRGKRAIGVVLSGTGTDGALGIDAIRAEGGMTIAEDPRSAAYGGMPEAAIRSGSVDHVVPACAVARHVLAHLQGGAIDAAAPGLDLGAERKLLALLLARTGHDFTHYKKSTVRRRIERRMGMHRIATTAAYLRHAQDNPAEIDALHKELLIGVTAFFRDADMLEALAPVFQKLVVACPEGQAVRVWVPGCSTGEEAYSLAILLREAMDRAGKSITVRLFATDADVDAIAHARAGVYPAPSAANVSRERLHRFFADEDGAYRIIKTIRDMIVFAPQNLLSDPPFTRLDLVSCRNVLIYMDAELQDRLMTLFHYALRPGGHLFLGSSESIGGHDQLFQVTDKKAKLYMRKPGSTQPRLTPRPAVIPPGRPTEAMTAVASRQASLPHLASTLLLQTHVPPSVLVSERGDVVYVHGSTGPFLEQPQGQPSFNVVQMARDGLKPDVEAVVRAANAQPDGAVERIARVKDGRGLRRTRLVARKVHEPEALRGLVLLQFESLPQGNGKDGKKGAAQAPRRGTRGAQLEEELLSTRQSLESTIEQLQASNEELQSANEELSSMNEELQSANEELEISKEETQALNEELHTVNAELRGTVDDLSRTNDDMTNLLNSTEIATIFLDRALRVRRFTTHATRVIHLIPTDVGRPLADIMPKLKYDRLVADAAEVFRTLVPREVELESKEGGWFLMRLLPYRTAQEQIDGIVMTFVDVTKLRDAEDRARIAAPA